MIPVDTGLNRAEGLGDPPTTSERLAALIRDHRRDPAPSSTPRLPPTTAATSPAPTPIGMLGSADPLHHTTTLTPPATLAPGDMVTSDANQLFYPEPTIPAVLVPRVRQRFPTKNDAYIFYKDYAKLAGFSLRTARTSKETNHWVCSREGKHDSKNKEEGPKTENGSKRCGCPAYVKVKKDGKHNL